MDLLYIGEVLKLPVRRHNHYFPYPHGHVGYIKAVTRRKYDAVYYAYANIGAPYVWGATGPYSFDCSGLTQAAYRFAGTSIPRTSYDQAALLPPAPKLRPGVLLYFNGNSHAAIYIGKGELIDAPHSGSTVGIRPLAGWYASGLDAIRNP